MKHMAIFTRSDGKRIGIATHDVHLVCSTDAPHACIVVYQIQVEDKWTKTTMSVVGTFDNIMAAIEDSNK